MHTWAPICTHLLITHTHTITHIANIWVYMHACMHRHIYGHTRLRTNKETNIYTDTQMPTHGGTQTHAHRDTWNLKEAIRLVIRQLVEIISRKVQIYTMR